jgi:hypothetical protein
MLKKGEEVKGGRREQAAQNLSRWEIKSDLNKKI